MLSYSLWNIFVSPLCLQAVLEDQLQHWLGYKYNLFNTLSIAQLSAVLWEVNTQPGSHHRKTVTSTAGCSCLYSSLLEFPGITHLSFSSPLPCFLGAPKSTWNKHPWDRQLKMGLPGSAVAKMCPGRNCSVSRLHKKGTCAQSRFLIWNILLKAHSVMTFISMGHLLNNPLKWTGK